MLIASNLTPEEREKIKEILLKRQKVLAWSYKDMHGINKEIAKYRIPIHPHMVPAKQKK